MLKKQFLKNKAVCKVTFTSPKLKAENIAILGDFNGWDATVHPMEALKDGRFKTTLELNADAEYQFRYLVNGAEWLDDDEADAYAPNQFGGQNSVVKTYRQN